MKNSLHLVGDIIGARYRIDDSVGQGGMQEVYLAYDLLLSRSVALKVPKSASAEKRFKRSAVVSARINHYNVAKTLDYVEENDRFYLIEEYVAGCDLSKLLALHIPRLDPYTVARVMHNLAKGMAASHHAGVVHRDLKPSNVMVGGGPLLEAIKITDFGIAKMAEKEIAEAVEGDEAGITASQTALGALPYMAPEMIEDMKTASQPVDVWALGAISFEVLVGRKPFGVGYKAVPAIMGAKLPTLPSTLHSNPQFALAKDIYQIIASCIIKDPSARPTADQLVNSCEGICYNLSSREFGVIESCEYGKYGFISADNGDRIFYHADSIFGSMTPSAGKRVWFSRYSGHPYSRAFPVVSAK